MAYPLASRTNFILYQRAVERQAYITKCEAASKHCTTGPSVAHCTRNNIIHQPHIIYTPQSCHQAMVPQCNYHPWQHSSLGYVEGWAICPDPSSSFFHVLIFVTNLLLSMYVFTIFMYNTLNIDEARQTCLFFLISSFQDLGDGRHSMDRGFLSSQNLVAISQR